MQNLQRLYQQHCDPISASPRVPNSFNPKENAELNRKPACWRTNTRVVVVIRLRLELNSRVDLQLVAFGPKS